jgi:Plasmid pRiA4b ORF-3-like protein
MKVYKIELYIDGNEDFYSEFALEANNSFEDFHKIIIKTLDLKNSEMASFFICDNKWNKEKEITLFDMKLDEEKENEKNYILTMKNTMIKDVVDDKHRLMHYVYDFLNMQTFNIELISIDELKEKKKYPICICCDNFDKNLIEQKENIEDDFLNNEEDIMFDSDELPEDYY